MPLKITCTHCGRALNVGDNLIGKKVRCPNCKGVVVAEAPTEDAPETPRPAKPTPQSKPAAAPRPKPTPQPVDEEPEEEAPPPKRKREPEEDETAPPPRKAKTDAGKTGAPTQVQPNGQWFLRFVVVLCALGGGVSATLLGNIWNENTRGVDPNRVKEGVLSSIPFLFGAGAAAVVGAILACLRLRWFAAPLLVIAVIPAAVLLSETFIMSGPLVLGGLLALFIKSRGTITAEVRTAMDAGKKRVPGTPLATVLGSVFMVVALAHGVFMFIALRDVYEKAERTRQAALNAPPVRVENLGRDPFNFPKQDPNKEIPFETIAAEVEAAGADIKMVKLDLEPAGINATIEVPEGCTIKKEEFSSIVQVVKAPRFELSIEPGRLALLEAKRNSFRTAITNTPDLHVGVDRFGKQVQFHFSTIIGHQDLCITNSNELTRAECMLGIKCARTMKLKNPVSDDPLVAIQPFLGNEFVLFDSPPFLDFGDPKKDQEAKADPTIVSLNRTATDATLRLLANRTEIRCLDLKGTKITASGLGHLTKLTNLEELILRRLPLKAGDLKNLPHFHKLRKLDLRDNSISEKDLEHLAGLSNLEQLNLGGGLSDDFQVAGLQSLTACGKLKYLNLSASDINDSGLVYLKNFKSLEALSLQTTKILGSELHQLKGLPNLKSLDLSKVKINDAGMAGLRDLVHLEELVLSNTEIQGPGLAELKNLTKLKKLDLNQTKVGDLGIAHLRGLSELESLSLSNTKITDDGLAHLKELKKLKKLTINSTTVTDEGYRHLDGLEELVEVEAFGTKITNTRRPKKVKLPDPGKLGPPDVQALIDRRKPRVEMAKDDPKVIVGLIFQQGMTDADLADLRDLKTLKKLHLGFENEITDAGLVYLKNLTELNELGLGGTKVEGETLNLLAGLTKLQKLYLPHRDYTSKQLEPLKTLVNLEEFPLFMFNQPDVKLEILSHMPKLRSLNLPPGVTEQGFAHLSNIVGLEHLTVMSEKAKPCPEASLAHIAKLTNLKILELEQSAIKGPGLEHLAGMKNLERLSLQGSPVSDEGLKHLGKLEKLNSLGLQGTRVTDAGLEHLQGCAEITNLYLCSTGIKGKGLEHLNKLKKLVHLDLEETPCEDEGLKHVGALTSLKVLCLTDTKITDTGLEHLKGLMKLEILILNNLKITGEGFAIVGELPALRELVLMGGTLSDAELKHFNKFEELQILNLKGTSITGSGLKDLTKLTRLVELCLDKTKITDENLKHIKLFPNLRTLSLAETPIQDAGLAHLKGLTKLEQLHLIGTKITDAGLEQLPGVLNFAFVDAKKTKVTKQGVAKLKKAAPGINIDFDE